MFLQLGGEPHFQNNSHAAGKASMLQGHLWSQEIRTPDTGGRLLPYSPDHPSSRSTFQNFLSQPLPWPESHHCEHQGKSHLANSHLGTDHTVSRPQSYREEAANSRLSQTI